jgi:hypothetical protein
MTQRHDRKPNQATVWINSSDDVLVPEPLILTRGGQAYWLSCECHGTVRVPAAEVEGDFEPGDPVTLVVNLEGGEYTYEVELRNCRSGPTMKHLQGTIIIIDP